MSRSGCGKDLLLVAMVPALLLASCAMRHSFEPMDSGLAELGGIDTAVYVLGNPARKEAFGSDTVYYWSAENSRDRGAVICEIKIAANRTGRILEYSHTGTYASCQEYSNRLTSYLASRVR